MKIKRVLGIVDDTNWNSVCEASKVSPKGIFTARTKKFTYEISVVVPGYGNFLSTFDERWEVVPAEQKDLERWA